MRTFAAIAAILLAGAGCVPTVFPLRTPAEEAAALLVRAGSTITLSESPLGLAGDWFQAFGHGNTRVVTLERWELPHASLRWVSEEKIETEASKRAREAFEALPPAPVGEIAPKPPEPAYDAVTRAGEAHADDLDDGDGLLLPAAWTEGEDVSLDGRTLLWLSRAQYDSLVATRVATVRFGLFDEELAGAYEALAGFKSFIESLNKDAPSSTGKPDFDAMHADEQWGEYRLKVDGEEISVRTVQAGNWFARIVVLANPENPLVLQVKLTPAAYGPDALLSPATAFARSFGYEVVSITTK